jgi:hypothetical protein
MVTDDVLRKRRISHKASPTFAVLFLLITLGFLVWVLVTV